ncbi:MAG: hypothetical protein HS115_11730 [Spirochaetales bacterium]|nr:hypothetical protein [Spirochaetales bacterium]
MINEPETLKALLGVDGDTLGLDDRTAIAGLEQTAYEFWLETCAASAALDLARWLGLPVADLPVTPSLRQAEVLLVQSEIVQQFGLLTALSPARMKVGGDDGNEFDFQHIAAEERSVEAESLRRRAHRMATGEDAPGSFAEVLG